MLCYSWDALEQLGNIPRHVDKSPEFYEMISWILCRNIRELEQTGLDQGYRCEGEATNTPSGKIVFSESIRPSVFLNSRLFCEKDELSSNLLHNQILKTTLHRLRNWSNLSKDLREEILFCLDLFKQVDFVEIQGAHFYRLMFDRNNKRYKFLMQLCEMLHLNQLPSDIHGKYTFPDFLRDEKDLANLFERFVLRFYQCHLESYKVTRNRLSWEAIAEVQGDLQYLPEMKPDISLYSDERNIVIDTKFHRESLNQNEKVKSENLYQIVAYLNSREYHGDRRWEGMLLYPTTNGNLDLSYVIHGRTVRVCTIDLNRDWELIHKGLLSLVA